MVATDRAKPLGETIQILPLATATVAEETPGVACCQLIQTEPLKLTVRLSMQKPRPGAWAHQAADERADDVNRRERAPAPTRMRVDSDSIAHLIADDRLNPVGQVGHRHAIR